MANFITRNKKPLIASWLLLAVGFSAIMLSFMPFLDIEPTEEEIRNVFICMTLLLPLFFCLIIYMMSVIREYKIKKYLRYKPFADFFAKNDFAVQWVDDKSYWTFAEKVIVGQLLQKEIICKIPKNDIDRFDFIIYGLNADKVNTQKTFIKNVFNKEEPKFQNGLVCKNFKRTKTLTAETIASQLEALICKYE